MLSQIFYVGTNKSINFVIWLKDSEGKNSTILEPKSYNTLQLPRLFSSSACLTGRRQALCIDYGSFASLSGGDSGPAWQLSISP